MPMQFMQIESKQIPIIAKYVEFSACVSGYGTVCAPLSDGPGQKKAQDKNKIKICLRKITKSYATGKLLEMTTQEFYPAYYWLVRVMMSSAVC